MTQVVFPTLAGKKPDAHGTVAAWLVPDGNRVRPGQLVAEVHVEEASGQIAAPAEGELRRIVAEGQSVRQGTVVAFIE